MTEFMMYKTEINSDLVSELRSLFLHKLEEDHATSNYFHPHDMDKILKSDDWLLRFLLHHDGDVRLALNMVWDTCTWRKENDVNEINENNVNNDYLEDGSMFVHNRDKEGKNLFIFKCKNHTKGQKDFEQLKRCVIYWFERIERMEKCAMMTIFFDMQDTGLSNLDMEYIKFLIGLCKLYYPNFLNYILIFEMPWILNAAFKLIKSWLPPKGVQKIRFVNKNNLKDYVDPDQALTSWGGNDDYVFRFVPELNFFPSGNGNGKSDDIKKKVHFADGSPLFEGTPSSFGDIKIEENTQNAHLSVTPSDSVVFSEGCQLELSGTVRLTNVSLGMVTFKIKTTSPEKFRVRPSLGLLQSSASVSINVSVLPGFTAHSILRDKFLIMSCTTDLQSPNQSELSELWKAVDIKKINQHRLKCSVMSHSHGMQNGTAFNVSLQSHGYESDGEQKISQLISAVNHMTDCNDKILTQISYINMLEKIIIVLVVLLAIAIYLVYVRLPPESVYHYYASLNTGDRHSHSSCTNQDSSIFHETGYTPD